MRMVVISVILPLAACGSGSSLDGPQRVWIAADATEAEVIAAIDELEDAYADAFAESGDLVAYDDLPSASSVTYTGALIGLGQPDSGPTLDYAANLAMGVDFASGEVEGTVSNIATRLVGFDHPDGEIAVAGEVSNLGGYGWIEFDGVGPVSQGALAADFSVQEAYGGFVGTDSQVMGGYQATNFYWTDGPYDGTISSSDGEFIAVQQ